MLYIESRNLNKIPSFPNIHVDMYGLGSFQSYYSTANVKINYKQRLTNRVSAMSIYYVSSMCRLFVILLIKLLLTYLYYSQNTWVNKNNS